MIWVVFGCLLVGAMLPLTGAQAQSVVGTIQGYVTDEGGGDPLPGVTVEVKNQETGSTRTVVTDGTGFYKATALQPSDYTVVASLDGMQTVQAENVRLQIGQVLDVNFDMGSAETVTEIITVTSESPAVEVSRSSAATYVGEEEIEAIPVNGRDFTDFALLTPTVQNDTSRGFIVMSGQRGIYTGLNIDGVSNKSAFFGYGTGGEATENDGLVVAQDSVKEFQVITNGFAPEYGNNQGGYVNVVTQSGTNTFKGNIFYFTRDEGLASDLPRSPLDVSRGRTADIPVSAFDRTNWGASVGGPISRDKTHFFVSVDQTSRDEPISRSINTIGIWDAVMQVDQTIPGVARYLDGFTRNPDGTASGNFLRSVDNQIIFAKLDHQFNQSHSGSFRVNLTDYERTSSFKDEESLKTEDTTSFVASVVSVIGSNKINEFRIQRAEDNLDRLSQRVGEQIEAQIRLRNRDGLGGSSLGKFDFLPIFVEEAKLQIQNNFSYLFGSHDFKFGIDYQQDDLSQLFAGSKDGRYDFNTVQDFLDNNASNVRIYFGNVTNPNYDETQTVSALYAQDSFKPNSKWSVNYGFRYGQTDNPGGLPHLFPEGRDIPDDDHIAPRVGFAYSPNGRDVIRGGVGLFYGRTPSLLFASQVQQNGLFPNFGRLNVGPGDVGFVPFGQQINNTNPPLDAPNSPSYVDPSFSDAETMRLNLGYERELNGGWVAGVDLVYAEGSDLQSNVELNRTLSYDQFGRPRYSSVRPDPNFNEIFVRKSIGESEYEAITLKVRKRWNGRYQMQAHYTLADDRDTDSNERSATGVTVSDPTNIGYDWGPSSRDVENRLVVSGLVELPWKIKLSGVYESRSGRPFNPFDSGADFGNCGFGRLGFNCTDTRPVDANGNILGRNSFRNGSFDQLDLRVGKAFAFASRYEVEVFAQVFNFFDESYFEVDQGFGGQADPSAGDFGLGSVRIQSSKQWELGARFKF